ncbi:MAG: hypothetical protein LUJ09_04950 [Firmicutes bacterium]|nr:hypothetical protein [Bacillota bacterium]
MRNEQVSLNKALLDAAEICDLEKVKLLLQEGADPLGISDINALDENPLGELFCDASQDSKLAAKLPQIVQLFLNHGMHIDASKFADDGNNVNPLWDLAFCSNESGIKTLRVLLDGGLDADSVETLVDHIFTDTEMVDGCNMDDAWFMKSIGWSLKMVMLAASYPHILQNSPFIAECVALEHNDAAVLPEFRDWNRFTYDIDLSTCDNIPNGLRNATLTIRRKGEGTNIWTMKI